MKYVLITTNGQRFYFYIRECAEMYKVIHGGEVFTVDKETKMIVWRADHARAKYG